MQCRAHLLAALTAALVASGCAKKKDETAPSPAPTDKQGTPAQTDEELSATLAKIDGVVITVREFQDRINRQSPYIRARYNSLEQKKEFLDNLVRFEVLAQAAKSRGLDKDPDVVRTMKQVMIQKLMKDEFEAKFSPDSITEEEMQAYYQAHQAEYQKPEEVRVSAVVLKNKKEADQVAKQALGDKGSTNKGFRELVAKYSMDEQTKLRGGDLRYFARDTKEFPAEVVKAAFGLAKTGDVVGPVKADGKFYILKQTGHRKAINKTFEQVKRQVQNRLYRDKRTEGQKKFVEGLRSKAKIELFESNLSKVRIDTSAAASAPHGHGNLPAMPSDPGHSMEGQPLPPVDPPAPEEE
jgi:peptidyl-prolyl cis-trans isomerase C